MKLQLTILAFCCLPFLAAAQSKPILQFYDQYQGLDNVSDIKLQGWVLRLASRFADEEQGEKLLQKITQLRVMTMEDGNLVTPRDYQRLLRDVKRDAFEELIKVKDKGQHIDLLIREKEKTITDVLLMIHEADGFILLSLEGALQFSDLNDIDIEVEGIDQFKKLPERKSDVPQA